MLPSPEASCGGAGAGQQLFWGWVLPSKEALGQGWDQGGVREQGGTPLPVHGAGVVTLGIPSFQMGAPSRHPGVF